MAINLQQFLAKQLSDGVIDQQLCDLLNAVADLSKEINDKVDRSKRACRRSKERPAAFSALPEQTTFKANTRKNLTSSQMKSLWKASSGPVP